MPRGDHVGPMGCGPRSGRGAGYCTGYAVPGFMNVATACGRGFRGYGGWHVYNVQGFPGWARHGYQSGWGSFAFPEAFCGVPEGFPVSAMQEEKFLKKQASILEKHLSEINKRLVSLVRTGNVEEGNKGE